ncbi:MAG: DUF1566 domain-containing protein [Burkholderiales bacterium]|nr:DUF1566 domain-containing protein [Burkholderiales bacterium]
MVPAKIAAHVLLPGCLAIALALPGLACAGQVDQILDQLATLNAKIDILQATVDDVADFRGLTQSWDKSLPAAERFTVLAAFNNQAVRDNNTGLVWERAPGSTLFRRWHDARLNVCAKKLIVNQKGWRLPSLPELTSLIDMTAPPGNARIQPGHPFLNVQPVVYWTATTDADDPTTAWGVSFGTGGVDGHDKVQHQNATWCVRGGMNADRY